MPVWKNAVLDASAQFDRKREVLLREAGASFNRRGYHGTSLAEIAKKLGVTKAALYTYVPSKEDLLYYCHDSAMDTAIESLHKARAGHGSGLQKLSATLLNYLETMLGEDGAYVVLLEENAMKPVHMRAIVRRRDQFEQGLRGLVAEGVADGSIVPCNPNGLPIAYTRCPTVSPCELASVAGCTFGAVICNSARSWFLSTPTTVALYLCLSESVTSTRCALLMT